MHEIMLIWVAAIVVVAAWGAGLAAIANAAASRGHNQVVWTTVAVVISVCCVLAVWQLPLGSMDTAGGFAALLAPPLLIFVSLAMLRRWLCSRPIKVPELRIWPVCCRSNGTGQLEISRDAVQLTWQDRSQRIARSELQTVTRDGECLRLIWDAGELVLLPMLPPQTRDGRIQQSQTLARLLAPALPTAIQVHRR